MSCNAYYAVRVGVTNLGYTFLFQPPQRRELAPMTSGAYSSFLKVFGNIVCPQKYFSMQRAKDIWDSLRES